MAEPEAIVVPDGPIRQAPLGPGRAISSSEAIDLLLDALGPVELGYYDHRIIGWLAGWDNPTILTVASLFQRARAAGQAEGGRGDGGP